MVTTFDISSGGRARTARATRADCDNLRYRLDVVGVSAIDVVEAAGGWLYDRVMAGWEVTVLLAQGCDAGDALDARDARALRILGVRALGLNSELAWTTVDPVDPTHQSLAVSAEAFTSDAGVRRQVLQALDDRSTEVALWGDGWPIRVNRGVTSVQHVLSAAARAFKGHALAAAGSPCHSVDPAEALLCDLATCLPVDSGLIRLG
jgi:hypothetical protein